MRTAALGAAGVVLAGASTLHALGAPAPRSTATPGTLVYRLSSRNHRAACTACRAHGANRYYSSAEAAEAGRAHPGCSCKVLSHEVAKAQYDAWFADASRTVHDARWDS